MSFYLTFENGVRGHKCSRCSKFIPDEEFVTHVCECYGGNQFQTHVPVTRDSTESDKPTEPPPPFRRNRRTKNWHLDPKYKNQWGRIADDQNKPS